MRVLSAGAQAEDGGRPLASRHAAVAPQPESISGLVCAWVTGGSLYLNIMIQSNDG